VNTIKPYKFFGTCSKGSPVGVNTIINRRGYKCKPYNINGLFLHPCRPKEVCKIISYIYLTKFQYLLLIMSTNKKLVVKYYRDVLP
jgi:hypothetical protein